MGSPCFVAGRSETQVSRNVRQKDDQPVLMLPFYGYMRSGLKQPLLYDVLITRK